MAEEPETGTGPTARPDRRKLYWTAGFVVLLAFVIFGMAALSSPKDSSEDRVAVPVNSSGDVDSARSERLYEQALDAQRAGETTRALELAKQAAKADPGNTRATQLSVTLSDAAASSAGGAVSSGGSIAGTPAEPTPSVVATPAAGSVPTQPRVAKIESLLPSALVGYSLGIVQAVEGDAVVSVEPDRGSADAKTVTTALFSVHDRKSDKAARDWVDKIGDRLYSADRAKVVVAGSPGLFGNDGRRLAWVAFARGPYVFEVVVTARTTLASAKAIALNLASAFPIKN